MKLGPVELYWNPGPVSVVDLVNGYLRGPVAAKVIARMARSEVKNYLSTLAEKAELPFGTPEQFLRDLDRMTDLASRAQLTALTDLTNLRIPPQEGRS